MMRWAWAALMVIGFIVVVFGLSGMFTPTTRIEWETIAYDYSHDWIRIAPREKHLLEPPVRVVPVPEPETARVWVEFRVASNCPSLKLELIGSGGKVYRSWEVSPTSPVAEYCYGVGLDVIGLRVTNPSWLTPSYYTYAFRIQAPRERVEFPYFGQGLITLFVGVFLIGLGWGLKPKRRPA